MKPIDGSIRSRLSRILFRGSLTLLGITLVYWAIAARYGVNFASLSGTDEYDAAAVVLPGTHQELAWFVDSQAVLCWHAADPAGRDLPLARRYGMLHTLFQVMDLDLETGRSQVGFGLGSVITFRGVSKASGGPITLRIVYLPMLRLAGLFAAYPLLLLPVVAWRFTGRRLAGWRLVRLRRFRAGLGRCVCGYDLRGSRARCPECGVPFRMVPVSLPSVRRRVSAATA